VHGAWVAASTTKIRALSIDAVGTMIVPHPGVGEVYARIARDFAIDRSALDLDQAFPAAFAQVRSAWKVPYGADEDDARRFWTAVIEATFGQPVPQRMAHELYDAFAHAECWRVLPNVTRTLSFAAAQGLPVMVVSNFDGRLAPVLDGLGLGPFAQVVTSSMVGTAKPDPAALLFACARLGLAAHQVLHLGDSQTEDGDMAAVAGAHWIRCSAQTGIPFDAVIATILGQ
jgi:putative hydrolase of the HAD superfamily